MATHRFRAAFPTGEAFLRAFESEIGKGGLVVRGAEIATADAMAPCHVAVEVGAGLSVEVVGQVAAVIPGLGVAVAFAGVPRELAALATRLRAGEALAAGGVDERAAASPAEAPPPPAAALLSPDADGDGSAPAESSDPALSQRAATAAERLARLSPSQKMQIALSGDRDIRLAVLRDINKILHVYALRNPRIGLDEVQYAAKLPGLSPEAVKLIAEHPDWGLSAAVCANLVRNPATPTPLALRMLPRIANTDLRAIARGGARQAVVQAARKLLNL